jgi:hypothetical protein
LPRQSDTTKALAHPDVHRQQGFGPDTARNGHVDALHRRKPFASGEARTRTGDATIF